MAFGARRGPGNPAVEPGRPPRRRRSPDRCRGSKRGKARPEPVEAPLIREWNIVRWVGAAEEHKLVGGRRWSGCAQAVGSVGALPRYRRCISKDAGMESSRRLIVLTAWKNDTWVSTGKRRDRNIASSERSGGKHHVLLARECHECRRNECLLDNVQTR